MRVAIPHNSDAFAYLEFCEGTSDKFWEARLAGVRLVTRWGRRGFEGQSKTEDFPDVTKAFASYEKQVGAKLAKGYHINTELGDRLRTLSDSLHTLGRDRE